MSENLKDVLLLLFVLLVGVVCGARYHHVYTEPGEHPVVDCADDEYWTAYVDDPSVDDLRCIHVDAIVTLNVPPMIVCPDGNVYYKPEEAPC
jgi:hypothetical protein